MRSVCARATNGSTHKNKHGTTIDKCNIIWLKKQFQNQALYCTKAYHHLFVGTKSIVQTMKRFKKTAQSQGDHPSSSLQYFSIINGVIWNFDITSSHWSNTTNNDLKHDHTSKSSRFYKLTFCSSRSSNCMVGLIQPRTVGDHHCNIWAMIVNEDGFMTQRV